MLFILLFRCQIWLKNSGNSSLLNLPLTQLNKKCFLCPDHFELNQFMSSERKRLIPEAVPTYFNNPCIDEEIMLKYFGDNGK